MKITRENALGWAGQLKITRQRISDFQRLLIEHYEDTVSDLESLADAITLAATAEEPKTPADATAVGTSQVNAQGVAAAQGVGTAHGRAKL